MLTYRANLLTKILNEIILNLISYLRRSTSVNFDIFHMMEEKKIDYNQKINY